MKHGYSRDGETVTLTMSAADYELLLMCLGQAAGVASQHPGFFWRAIALANRLNAGNPEFTPYEIPEEFA